ncbi:MAG: polysaccharide deacetylase family protein, partial [Planctomycetaceae bacterium]|nr:polysaccharide deacetylase family protein [Planctomycetaceae bacterium]
MNFVTLMYHNVCDRAPCGSRWPGYDNISPSVTGYFADRSSFVRHCELLAASRQAVKWCDLQDELSGRPISTMTSSFPSHLPRVLLTFDDGWRGAVEIGGPLLEKFGLQALLFVTTGLIGHRHFIDRRFLEQAQDAFVVGSHGVTHRLLAELPDVDVRTELKNSKSCLEDLLGREVDVIAYPGGSFDRRVLRMTHEAGYKYVFTSRPQVNRRSTGGTGMGRLAVKQGTPLDTIDRWIRGDLLSERMRSH